MSDASKNNFPQLDEADKAELEKIAKSNDPGWIKALGVAATGISAYQKKQAEMEAAKPPEQRAREAQQREATAKKLAEQREKEQLAKKQQEAARRHIELTKLYAEWCRWDTWLVQDEALPLLFGLKPGDFFLLQMPEKLREQIWKGATRCAGHSLELVNPADKPDSWRVKPAEWVRWLNEKKFYVPLELEEALRRNIPELMPEGKTERANQSRERRKADRLAKLKRFIARAEELAREHGEEWDRTKIPVTKGDFLAVFWRFHPEFKSLSGASFDGDFTHLRAKFAKGVRCNKNNVLNKLFSKVKTL